MVGRSFRERYVQVLGQQPERPRAAADSWPLPRGATLIEIDGVPCATRDVVVDGEEAATVYAAVRACATQLPGRFHHPSRLAFLDTETTGLSGGTGTHVFLVGIGRFHDGALHVRQLFLRHPGEEPALLAALERELAHVATLVTFNGRAFDVPLLETRYRLHRRPAPVPETHVDILGLARSIWKHRLESCALSALEQAVLGVQRNGDVPGWLVPQLYFDYLRSRRPEVIEPVFAHNHADIVSLARLAGLLSLWEAGLAQPEHPSDRLALALARHRRAPCEATLLDLAAGWHDTSVSPRLRLQALREVSVTLKRQRRDAEACAYWQQALTDPERLIRVHAAEELAKYLEHRQRDHRSALDIARRAVDGALLARDEAAAAAFARRVRRLEQKLLAERPGRA